MGRPASTVGKVLHRLGLSRPPREPRPAFPRCERERAGELLHVAVDDHSRLACAELLPSERAEHAVAFLRRAARWYAAQGIEVEQA